VAWGTLRSRLVSPRHVVAATAILSFAVWGALAYAADVPRFFLDELLYMKTGTSVAQGHGLRFHGQAWGYGPLFPLLIGGIGRVVSNQERTYELVKVANASFFALAAIPIYLVSRRVLPPWPSVAVVGLAAIVPSSMYVSVVMTESLGYLLCWWAIYAITLTLERPTAWRQVATIGVGGIAVLERPQFVSLFAGYLLGLVVVAVCSPAQRTRVRTAPLSLWPTIAALGAGLFWVVRPLARGGDTGGSLGSYASLAGSYDPLEVGKWIVYELGDLALYLAVLPLVIAPVVIVLLVARARRGSDRDGAFLATFVGQNVASLVMVAAFASTSFGLGILYDRYLFYFVPLWLIAVGVWLHAGVPRPRLPLVVGACAAVAVVAALPFGVIGQNSWFNQFEALATKLWWKIGLITARLPVISLRDAAIVFALAAVTAVFVLPAHRGWLVPAAIACIFGANLLLAWRAAFVSPATYGASPPGTRSWVDDRLGSHASVTVLHVSRACNAGPEGFSLELTDFFNRSVAASEAIGGEGPTLAIRPSGELVSLEGGRAFRPGYVVTQPGVELDGRKLAHGMATNLVLWQVPGPVRVIGAHSADDLRRTRCVA
jgi:hypothetical protein